MESLPAEVLQDIRWFALNSEFYLVSKSISTKLLPLHPFEDDVTFLLFCERLAPQGAWTGLDPFPWRTSPAARCDFRLSHDERTELQQVVLNQSWFTFRNFERTAARICKVWVENHWRMTDMAADEQRALENYFGKDVLYKRMSFNDLQQNIFRCDGRGGLSVRKRCSLQSLTETVVDIRAIPLKLFVPPRCLSKQRFFRLIRRLMNLCVLAYPRSALREAILGVVPDGDQDWFMDLFTYAGQYGVDVLRPQLFYEVYALIIRERSWSLLKLLCEGILLPEGFFESILKPDVDQAIKDGDIMGCEFLRWVEEEGWSDIQRREYCDAPGVTHELDRTPLYAFMKPLKSNSARD